MASLRIALGVLVQILAALASAVTVLGYFHIGPEQLHALYEKSIFWLVGALRRLGENNPSIPGLPREVMVVQGRGLADHAEIIAVILVIIVALFLFAGGQALRRRAA